MSSPSWSIGTAGRRTLNCLGSLKQCAWPRLTTVLVDNGSTDGTVSAVRAAFPAVKIVELPANLHFAAGANAGLHRGLELDADYLWLLNNDVTVAPDALAEMVRLAESDPSIGVVGSQLIHPVDPPGTIVGANCDFLTGAITSLLLRLIQPSIVWSSIMCGVVQCLSGRPFSGRSALSMKAM